MLELFNWTARLFWLPAGKQYGSFIFIPPSCRFEFFLITCHFVSSIPVEDLIYQYFSVKKKRFLR